MSGDTALPTVYYGGDPGPEDADRILVDGALQGALLIFNSLPPRLLGRFAASFMLSICMGSREPLAALENLSSNVRQTIEFEAMKPEGSA